jgi:hypothetical protein
MDRDGLHGLLRGGREEAEAAVLAEEHIERGFWVGVGGASSTRVKRQHTYSPPARIEMREMLCGDGKTYHAL